MYRNVLILGPPSHFPVGLEKFQQANPGVVIRLCHPYYADLDKFFFGAWVKDVLDDDPCLKLSFLERPLVDADLVIAVLKDSESAGELHFQYESVVVWPEKNGSVDLEKFIAVDRLTAVEQAEWNDLIGGKKEKQGVITWDDFSVDDKGKGKEKRSDDKGKGKEKRSGDRRPQPQLPYNDWRKANKEPLFENGSLKVPERMNKATEDTLFEILFSVACYLTSPGAILSREAFEVIRSDNVAKVLEWFLQFCSENGLPDNAVLISNSCCESKFSWSAFKSLTLST